MVESWIKVRTDDDCIISFNECVDIVLDIDDVEYLTNRLIKFLLEKQFVKEVYQ